MDNIGHKVQKQHYLSCLAWSCTFDEKSGLLHSPRLLSNVTFMYDHLPSHFITYPIPSNSDAILS